MSTKKVTTIVLFFVVLLLLGSTIYVSIILTSETDAPLTTNTRASEVDTNLDATDDSDTTDSTTPDPSNPDAEDPFTDPFAEPATDLGDGATPDPAAAPTGADGLPAPGAIGTDVPTDTESVPQNDNTLAYANPTPDPGTGTDTGSSDSAGTVTPTGTRQPADGLDVTPGAAGGVSPTSGLPDTGLGQPTNTPTPTFVPTQPPSPTTQRVQPTETRSMPVAGSIGGSILAVVVAGATIITALFL